MPPRSWKFRLADIQISVQKILEATEGHDRFSFEADDVLVHAVLMHLVIIGEAASQLPQDVLDASPDIPWNEVRGMRNFIAHAYFAINLDLIWRTVINDLEPLATALRVLSERLDSQLD